MTTHKNCPNRYNSFWSIGVASQVCAQFLRKISNSKFYFFETRVQIALFGAVLEISHIIEQTDLASILESLQKESQKTALLTSDGACDADLHKFIKIIDYKQFSNVTEREKHASNT